MAEARGKNIFKVIKYYKLGKSERTPTLHRGEKVTITFEEKAAKFRKVLFPHPPNIRMKEAEALTSRRIRWKQATNEGIGKAINTSAPDKAPGPDGLHFCWIQERYKAIPERLNDIYRTLAKAGYHPKAGRKATVVIILKPGNQDYTIPKAY